MKKLWMFLIFSFFAVSLSYAGQRCPVEGHSFLLTSPGSAISYELTDFDCSFGPGCQGTCSFWYGDFTLGPLERIPLDFSCRIPRDAFPDSSSILIANIPFFVDANVTSLTCIPINMKDYHAIHIYGKVFYVPKDVHAIKFKTE